MGVEQSIIEAIEAKREENGIKARIHIANRLRDMYGVEVYDELQPTQYNNVWSTGRVCWASYPSGVRWCRTPAGEEYDLSEQDKLMNRLRGNRWTSRISWRRSS
jgi:hypothetical protein